jgi:hypothetical protein
MDPFSGMHGFDNDDDDEEEIVFIENGRVTVIKTGNSNRNHGKRGNKYGQRRRNNDTFQTIFDENYFFLIIVVIVKSMHTTERVHKEMLERAMMEGTR